MSNSKTKGKERRPRIRPDAQPSQPPTKKKPLPKIANTSDPQEQIVSKPNRYLPEPVTVFVGGRGTELKTLEEFSIAADEIYDNYEDDSRPIVEIDVGKALNWHPESIQGVVNWTRSFNATLRREGVACQGDLYDVLLQTDVDPDDINGYHQFKQLMLQVSARFYSDQHPPKLVSLKQRLTELEFTGDDLRKLKSKELEIRQQVLEEQIDSVPVSDRMPIYEMISGIPIPKKSRQIVAPNSYSVTWQGVGHEIEIERVFLRTPLVITAVYKDIYTGAVLVKLVFRCQGKFVSRVVSRDAICDKRKLLDLSKFGLPVTNDNAMEVVRYLQAFERDNQFRIEQSATIAHLGIQRVERKVPKITDRDVKLSKKSLAKIETLSLIHI